MPQKTYRTAKGTSRPSRGLREAAAGVPEQVWEAAEAGKKGESFRLWGSEGTESVQSCSEVDALLGIEYRGGGFVS